MVTRKRAKRRGTKRLTYVLLKRSEQKQIREFSKFIPKLADYKGKERLTSSQYGFFKKAKSKLRYTDNLKPVTELQAKKLKGKLVGGGIRAIQLRSTAPDKNVKVKSVLKGGVIVTTNGRDWEYHPVRGGSSVDLTERLIEKARELFNRAKHPPWQAHLWTTKGRANEGASSFKKFAQMILLRMARYSNADDFIVGVAILVRDGKRGYRPEIKRKAIPYEPELEDDEDE